MTKRKAENEVCKEEENDLKIEIETQICKKLFFCCGLNGIIQMHKIEKSELIKTIPSKAITYCISSVECSHKTENEIEHLYTTFNLETKLNPIEMKPFNISAVEICAFFIIY
jgi:hypothetical protein